MLIETEACSAGEQHARDKISDRQKCQSMGCVYTQPIDIFRGHYTFKNSSINLRLRLIESPL
jgi:hypothetical protein